MAAKRRQLVSAAAPTVPAPVTTQVEIGAGPVSPEPLRVTCRLRDGISFRHAPHLDSILEWVVCDRHGLRVPPAAGTLPTARVTVPIAESACGRYRLCSVAEFSVEESETRHKHRRAPVMEYARLGSRSIRRVHTGLAENKSYRVPYEHHLLRDDALVWHCIGDAAAIRELLWEVHYLGRFRGAGKGEIAEWIVEPCEPWGPGFPILRDGLPTRALPEDTDGAREDALHSYSVFRPPYWDHTREEPCLVPPWW